MRSFKLFVFSASLLLAGSCMKEEPAGESGAAPGIPVTMTASTGEMSRIALDGTVFTWKKGDEVKLRWASPKYSSTTDCEHLKASEDGRSVTFEGTFSEYKEGENLYAYYSTDGEFANTRSVAFRKKVPALQSGKLSDIKDNVLFYSWIRKAGITLDKEGDEIVGMHLKAEMSPFFALLKIRVPSSLGYTSLRVEASSLIAGSVQIQPQRTWGTWGSDSFAYRPSGASMEQGVAIDISDGGNVLPDEVYIAVLPDAYDEDKKNYYCSTESLRFTLSGPAGEVSFEKNLDGRIYCGTVKDLGSVPGSMTPIESGLLYLMDREQLTVSVADTLEHCEFYYETGTTEDNCAVPTTSSERFYAKNGFQVPSDLSYNRHYIKVLIRKSLPFVSEVVAKGYLRSWNFDKDSPVADAIGRNATLFPAVGDTFSVADMLLYRENVSDLGYSLYDDHIRVKTCFLAMNAVARNDAQAWFYFKVDKSYSRGYKLFNDNATFGTSAYNGNPTTASVVKDTSDPDGNVSFVWNLGQVGKDRMFGLRGDGIHAYHSMAFLETGDDVTSPVKEDMKIALKIQEGVQTPAVVLDTAVVGQSLSAGAKYWFITGTEGFDAMGEPSDSDAKMTGNGICIPVQNKSDRMYIKVLGRCEGCEDVYLKAIVRNWKYDINYIAPTSLETGYDGLTFTLNKMWSDTTVTDNRIGYIGCQAGKTDVVAELDGRGWINASFFAGSFGTTFKMLHGTEQLYRIDMPAKVYYSENSLNESVCAGDIDEGDMLSCQWSYRIWLRNMIFLEEAYYIPASYDAGDGNASIEDFDGNINYTL